MTDDATAIKRSSRADLAALQLRRLRRVVAWAAERVPLYRKWHFSLRVHGTRGELTTEPIDFDEPQRYAYELVLKSNGNRAGAAELELSLRRPGDD